MILTNIADAFTANDFKTMATFSTWIQPLVIQEIEKGNFPLYILSSEESDPNDDLSITFKGKIKVILPVIYCFDKTDENAVENKLLWIKEVFKSLDGEIGFQDHMPVNYTGILFHAFEPFNETIDEDASPYEGVFVSSEKLRIGASLIT